MFKNVMTLKSESVTQGQWSTSSWPRSCTRRCTAGYHGTCQAIVSSSPTQVANYGRPTRLHLPCHGSELVWVTDCHCCRTTDMEQSAGRSAPGWQLCSS